MQRRTSSFPIENSLISRNGTSSVLTHFLPIFFDSVFPPIPRLGDPNYGAHRRTHGWRFLRSRSTCSLTKSPCSRPTANLLLKFWRQRLITFRIDPSQLSYANKGKIVASGGYGCVRKAILLPQVSQTNGNPEAHGWPTIASETAVAVKSLQAHGDIDLERFEKVRRGHVHVAE